MIKLIFNRIFATLLTLLVLISTVSLTVEKHFCGDNLIDLSYFSSSKKCGMDSADMHLEGEMVTKSCCKDVIELISSPNDLDVNDNERLNQFEENFIAAFMTSYASLFKILPKKTVPYLDYSEPLLVYDITLLDQVFLI